MKIIALALLLIITSNTSPQTVLEKYQEESLRLPTIFQKEYIFSKKRLPVKTCLDQFQRILVILQKLNSHILNLGLTENSTTQQIDLEIKTTQNVLELLSKENSEKKLELILVSQKELEKVIAFFLNTENILAQFLDDQNLPSDIKKIINSQCLLYKKTGQTLFMKSPLMFSRIEQSFRKTRIDLLKKLPNFESDNYLKKLCFSTMLSSKYPNYLEEVFFDIQKKITDLINIIPEQRIHELINNFQKNIAEIKNKNLTSPSPYDFFLDGIYLDHLDILFSNINELYIRLSNLVAEKNFTTEAILLNKVIKNIKENLLSPETILKIETNSLLPDIIQDITQADLEIQDAINKKDTFTFNKQIQLPPTKKTLYKYANPQENYTLPEDLNTNILNNNETVSSQDNQAPEQNEFTQEEESTSEESLANINEEESVIMEEPIEQSTEESNPVQQDFSIQNTEENSPEEDYELEKDSQTPANIEEQATTNYSDTQYFKPKETNPAKNYKNSNQSNPVQKTQNALPLRTTPQPITISQKNLQQPNQQSPFSNISLQKETTTPQNNSAPKEPAPEEVVEAPVQTTNEQELNPSYDEPESTSAEDTPQTENQSKEEELPVKTEIDKIEIENPGENPDLESSQAEILDDNVEEEVLVEEEIPEEIEEPVLEDSETNNAPIEEDVKIKTKPPKPQITNEQISLIEKSQKIITKSETTNKDDSQKTKEPANRSPSLTKNEPPTNIIVTKDSKSSITQNKENLNNDLSTKKTTLPKKEDPLAQVKQNEQKKDETSLPSTKDPFLEQKKQLLINSDKKPNAFEIERQSFITQSPELKKDRLFDQPSQTVIKPNIPSTKVTTEKIKPNIPPESTSFNIPSAKKETSIETIPEQKKEIINVETKKDQTETEQNQKKELKPQENKDRVEQKENLSPQSKNSTTISNTVSEETKQKMPETKKQNSFIENIKARFNKKEAQQDSSIINQDENAANKNNNEKESKQTAQLPINKTKDETTAQNNSQETPNENKLKNKLFSLKEKIKAKFKKKESKTDSSMNEESIQETEENKDNNDANKEPLQSSTNQSNNESTSARNDAIDNKRIIQKDPYESQNGTEQSSINDSLKEEPEENNQNEASAKKESKFKMFKKKLSSLKDKILNKEK